MSFSKKLQNLRKEKGLSQEKLAEIVGVSRQAISKWELGQSYPEMDKLIILSDIFGVSIDSLIKDNELSTNIKNKQKSNENDEDEEWEINIIIGLFVVGISVGFILNNFLLGTVGALIGFGITYIIKGIKRTKDAKFTE